MSHCVSYLRGARYRAWARLLHRLNLHHTRRIGPLIDDEGDGAYLIRCEWCGLSMSEPDRFAKIRRAAAAR